MKKPLVGATISLICSTVRTSDIGDGDGDGWGVSVVVVVGSDKEPEGFRFGSEKPCQSVGLRHREPCGAKNV